MRVAHPNASSGYSCRKDPSGVCKLTNEIHGITALSIRFKFEVVCR